MRSDDYVLFAERALDGMAAIVSDLGQDLANRSPGLPGANSPYQILTHCLGVLDYWVGDLVAGREIHRDRDAEFRAAGSADALVSRVEEAKRQLRADLGNARPSEPVRAAPVRAWMPVDRELTQEAVLLHVLEELCQHCGHMELTRDILRREHATTLQ